MWTYVQKTGELLHNNVHVANGYSGYLLGKNNPDMQRVPQTGPIPVGTYAIGEHYDTPSHGPFVLPLYPGNDNQMFGRSGFLIHGDSLNDPGNASRGCIIMPRPIRDQIYASGDKVLEVISGQ